MSVDRVPLCTVGLTAVDPIIWIDLQADYAIELEVNCEGVGVIL